MKKILIVAPAVAPIGDGRSMGVNRGLEALVLGLEEQGYSCTVLAPKESYFSLCKVIEVEGALQPSHMRSEKVSDPYPVLPQSCIANMWSFVESKLAKYDIILNLQHDWLPYYLTPFFLPKIFHWANLTSINDATDFEIRACQQEFPNRVIFKSRVQANIISPDGPSKRVIHQGLRSEVYPYREVVRDGPLVWAARISPEKGLEDSLVLACMLEEALHVAGYVEDQEYFDALQDRFQDNLVYHGYLNQEDLGHFLSKGRAFLQTQKWQEAFGMTTVEALACGTPVVAYARGANSELVEDGLTGFLTPPDDLEAMKAKIVQINEISRSSCRKWVEKNMSIFRLGKDFDELFLLAE